MRAVWPEPKISVLLPKSPIDKPMSRKAWFLSFAIAFVFNLVVFLSIPYLSSRDLVTINREFTEPIILSTYRPGQPKSHLQKRDVPKPNLPKKVPETAFSQRKEVGQIKPDLGCLLPEKQFSLQAKLKTDIEIFSSGVSNPLPGLPSGLGEFELGEVDQAPKLINKVKPIYPFIARRRNISGKVVVRFLVDEHGYVRKITIEEARPKGVFEQSVLMAVKKWRFAPGRYQGMPVPTWIRLPIQFNLAQ